jgi:hypothetical protein
MEVKQRIEIKSNNFLPYSESSLKIGNTKISLSKENHYTIESTGLLLDSINENLMHSHGYGHGSNHAHVNRRVKTISTSSMNGKQVKTKPKTKKELYDRIKIEFNAETVVPLTTFLNKHTNKHGTEYNVILHFIGNIGNQLTFLRNHGYSIPFFSLEDFIVIDDSVFSFMNDEKLFKIDDETKNITIDFPIMYNKNNSFIPPHIAMGLDNEPDKIPLDVYFSSIYYSLAQICVYIFMRERIKDHEDYDKVSGPFIYTSLYWCLKRCLDKDENKRILLYV